MVILLAYAPAILALIGGIWAAQRIRRPDLRDRPDRSTAIGIAAAVAVIAGLGVGWLGGLSAVIFSGSEPNVAVGLAFGVVGGACFGLAGLLGYALLARLGIGRVALAGVLLGPAILVGGTVVASFAASSIELAPLEKAVAEHNSEVAARSTALHLAVEGKQVETAHSGTVIAVVHLRLRLSTDVAMSFTPNQPCPCVVLFPPDPDAALYLDADAPPGTPSGLRAGASQLVVLTMRYPQALIDETKGTYRAGPPGTWTLRLSFVDPADREYEVKQPLELP